MVKEALVMDPRDNVATVVEDIEPGTNVPVNVSGKLKEIKVKQKIPFGHKFAIIKISKDEKVIKYGEVIGLATQPIAEGDHVHIHNVHSVYSLELIKERREKK
ncbi:MAG: UxaA family hydrolase [Candidatus Jordarchaeum sp.]|uniref:UxaA family hydrolase n=1 Tax=Candidatus Jordarchaeum sp. TaxID=2823881 RepID=UPI0040498A3F